QAAAAAFAAWGGTRAEADVFHRLAIDHAAAALNEHASDFVLAGLQYDGTNPRLVGDMLTLAPPIDSGDLKGAVDLVVADSPARAVQLAGVLRQAQQSQPAQVLYERVLELHPDAASAWAGLAEIYAARGLVTRAEETRAKATALDPASTRPATDGAKPAP